MVEETVLAARRRTVVRGAVWAAPVISVVAAAPAFAVSTQCAVIVFTVIEDATNPASNKAVLQFTGVLAGASVRLNSASAVYVGAPGGPTLVGVIGTDNTAPYSFTANNNNSYSDSAPANGGLRATYTVNFTVTLNGESITCTKSFTTP